VIGCGAMHEFADAIPQVVLDLDLAAHAATGGLRTSPPRPMINCVSIVPTRIADYKSWSGHSGR
jgi:hypothetical protein